MITNIAHAVGQINTHIESRGFVARDADGNDFQRGGDRDLRFKTGTSYGEVAVQIVRRGKANPMETIRILSDDKITAARVQIDQIIEQYDFDFDKENGR